MSESDEKAFREQLARETGDAVYNAWAILAEVLIASGMIKKDVLIHTLKASIDEVARSHPDSLTHYVLHRAWASYSRDDDPHPDGPRRPTWLRGVVDGGAKKS